MPEETVQVSREYLEKLERVAQLAMTYWASSEAATVAGEEAGSELFEALEAIKPFQEK